MSIMLNKWDGQVTEALDVSGTITWRYLVIGHTENVNVWVEIQVTEQETQRILVKDVDAEELLADLGDRQITLVVKAQGPVSRRFHTLTRNNPGGKNALRWHLSVLSVELEEQLEGFGDVKFEEGSRPAEIQENLKLALREVDYWLEAAG